MPLRRLLLAAALLLLPAAVGAQALAPSAVAPGIVETPAEVLAEDGAATAALTGVPVDEAQRRLVAQEESVAFTDYLRLRYRDRLAGIAVEQAPVFRLVVLLTGDAPVADEAVAAGGIEVPVVFRTGAAATLDRLHEALADRQAAIRAALAHPPGMGIDQRTGELAIVVADTDLDAEGAAALTARLAVIAGVPVRVRSIDRPGVDAAAEGGMRLVGAVPGDPHRYLCTAGFAVGDGARRALTTAAHCPDALGWRDAAGVDHDLPFVGQWGWGYQDVQVNLADATLPPLFYADTARTRSRAVTGARGVAGLRAGDLVCHRGERTGYSCAAVELTDFAPAGDLCGGACLPTWVTVAGPRCGGGDSGAPVFVGTTALGLVKGGSYRGDGGCSFFFFMSTDYLPPPWRLLTAPPPLP